jgi:hypothetical protein
VVSIFKNNLFINSLLLLPYVIILRIKSLLDPVGYIAGEGDTIMVRELFDWISSPFAQSMIAVLVVYLQAVYINRLVIKNALVQQNTLIPGLIYIVLTSLFPECTVLSPMLIANSLILVIIGQAFKIYKSPRVADNVFNIGFWTGISALFVPNFIYLLLIGVLSIFILKSAKGKELFQLFSGAFTVFVLYFGIMYLIDYPILDQVYLVDASPKLSIISIKGLELYKFLSFVGMTFFAVFHYNTYALKKSIQAKKKIDILFWILFSSAVLIFLFQEITAFNALLVCIPLSIFYTMNLIRLKSPLLQELVHVIFLAVIFIFSFGLI